MQFNFEVDSHHDQLDLLLAMSILTPQMNTPIPTFHTTLAALGQISTNSSGNGAALSPQLEEAIAKWRKVIAANEPQQWTRRLAWDGLSEQSARMAIGINS